MAITYRSTATRTALLSTLCIGLVIGLGCETDGSAAGLVAIPLAGAAIAMDLIDEDEPKPPPPTPLPTPTTTVNIACAGATCGAFACQQEAQTYFLANGCAALDPDGDGIACEDLRQNCP